MDLDFFTVILDLSRVDLDFFAGFAGKQAVDLVFFWIESRHFRQNRLVSCGLKTFLTDCRQTGCGLRLFRSDFRLPVWSKEGGGGVLNEGFPHGTKKVMADFSTILTLFHRISAKWGCGLSLLCRISGKWGCGLRVFYRVLLRGRSIWDCISQVQLDLDFFVDLCNLGTRAPFLLDQTSSVGLRLFVDLCNLGTGAPFLLDQTSPVGLRLFSEIQAFGLVQSGYGSTFFIRLDKFSWT